MTDRSIESMSAMMDNEVEEFELRRTLDRLSEDPEASQQWRRYHVVRSAMHEEVINTSQIDISGAVMAALDDEPALHAPISDEKAEHNPAGLAERIWKPLTSMAVAASVTAIVILGAQGVNQPTDAPVLADSRPAYVLPSAVVPRDYVRAELGNRVSLSTTTTVEEPEVIRLSQGLNHYLNQHNHMLSAQEPTWQIEWLPNGFEQVRHEVMPEAEVMLFSNGRNAITVAVEKLGQESVPQGVAQSERMVAVAKRSGEHFVTVIGDVPLMIAERIASSVAPKQL